MRQLDAQAIMKNNNKCLQPADNKTKLKGGDMNQLFSIGYESAEIGNFISTLKENRVDVLVDIREFPISRRKGFSKKVLRNALNFAGIGYRHEKWLGSPKDLRHKLRVDHDYATFFDKYNKHLHGQSDLLVQLSEELSGNVVFMCYEKCHKQCHRSSVLDALATLVSKRPVHLGVRLNGFEKKATHSDISQSFPAT